MTDIMIKTKKPLAYPILPIWSAIYPINGGMTKPPNSMSRLKLATFSPPNLSEM